MHRVLAIAIFVSVLAAQEPDTPTFRTSTRLVQVDVVVRNSGGAVRGLTKEDFQLFDNGKRQEIAVFAVRDAAKETPSLMPLAPGAVTNRPAVQGGEPVSATVILIDSQNTYPEDQGYARLQALKFLDRTSRRELVAVYSLDTTLHVLQPFTADRDALRKAVDGFHMTQSLNMQDGQYGLLEGLTGNAANAMRAENFRRQAEITKNAFEAIAYQLAGMPGRKKFVWITAAPPLTFTLPKEIDNLVLNEYTNQSDQLFGPMKLMNDANVAVYPVDPRGALTSRTDPGITTIIRLAEMTGGKAYYGDNDVSIGIEEAFTDTDLTYTLGFYSTEERRDGAQHSLSVRVERPGVEVRHRKNYTGETEFKPVTEAYRKATLAGWVNHPLDATDIPLAVVAAPTVGKPGYYDVQLSVDASALRLEEKNGRFTGKFEVAIVPDVERKPKGLHQTIKVDLTAERLQVAIAHGIGVFNQVRVANEKGKLPARKLHIVVMDQATGKAGSVRVPVGN